MIRGVFLDLGWTLFRPVNREWFLGEWFFDIVGKEVLEQVPPEKRNEVFGQALAYLDSHHLLFTEEEEICQFQEFYKVIARGLPQLGISLEQAEEMGRRKVLDTGNYVFFHGIKDILQSLRQRYRLGIISDTWPSVERILKSGGIDGLFDCKTYSCHLGVWKPHRRMYQDALEKMGFAPEQTVFVDDDEDNLAGAAQWGIRPVLITWKQGGERGAGENRPYPTIPHMGALWDLLEALERE